MPGVVYDTGALIAAERGNRAVWGLHQDYVDDEVTPVVPATVLAEAWRGGARQALLSRCLADCRVIPLDESIARSVGRLLGRAHFDDIVDASVVVAASGVGGSVVTSNPAHIQLLAEAWGTPLDIVAL